MHLVPARVQLVERQRRRVDDLHVLVAAVRFRAAARHDQAGLAAVEPPAGREAVVVLLVAVEKLVVAAADGAEQPQLLRRLLHHEVDAAADRVGVHVGRQRLGHFDRLQQLRRHDVDRDLTNERIGRRNPLAVDHHRVEPRLGAADVHVAALALILGDRHAGNALRRLGGVAVRKRADLIGRDDVGDVRRGLLLVERALLRVENQLVRHGDALLEGHHPHLDVEPLRRAGDDFCLDDRVLPAKIGDDDGAVARRNGR